MAAVEYQVSALPKPFEQSAVDFGAELSGIDLEHIDGNTPSQKFSIQANYNKT